MPKYFVPTALPARVRAARLAGDDYGVTAQPDWRTIDWLSHLHQLEIDGRPVNHVDIGAGTRAQGGSGGGRVNCADVGRGPGEPIVFVHGLGGQWQNWLENLPRAAQER